MTVINVTQEHIDKGKRNSMRSCPIALAIKDKVRWYKNVEVLPYKGVTISGPFSLTITPLPPLAKEFIKAFDSGYDPKPFSFEL